MQIRQFIHEQFVPNQARWREQHRPDAEAWMAMGRCRILLPDFPENMAAEAEPLPMKPL